MPRPFFNEKKIIASMIRVNHAGEKGAIDIYRTQLKYIKCKNLANEIRHMCDNELEHLHFFESKIKQEHINYSLFLPIWHIGANILGYITAKLGKNFIMVTTASIESVIIEHYQEQINYLSQLPQYEALRKKLIKIRQEELLHHHVCNNQYDSQSSFGIMVANYVIKYICKAAIFISKKV